MTTEAKVPKSPSKLHVTPIGLNRKYLWLKAHEEFFRPFIDEEYFTKLNKIVARMNIKYENIPTLEEQPTQIVGGKLREYQLVGVNFFIDLYNHGLSGILADEMGLGKTLQTISFLSYLTHDQHISLHHLIICPLSVLNTWVSEFKRWCPKMRVITFHGIATERERLKKVAFTPGSFDVCVTTYDMVNVETSVFQRKFMWGYIILDEGHKIKNEQSNIAKAVHKLHTHYRILLTGTPVQNNLRELWALLYFLMPDVFTEDTAENFGSGYVSTGKKWDAEKLQHAHKLLQQFMLRRIKSDVELSLPNLEEVKLYVPLSPMQRFWYKRILAGDTATLGLIRSGTSLISQTKGDTSQAQSNNNNENIPSSSTEDSNHAEEEGAEVFAVDGNNWKRLHSILMQLRKACNHPFLFPNSEPEPIVTNEQLIKGASKLVLLDKLLPKLKSEGHRVLIFSQFTTVLDILEDYLLYRDYVYTRLDGSSNRILRNLNVRLYNKPGSEYFVFLITTRAGGLGLNIATADTVILFDSDWNPQADVQAMARAHRIGQTKKVTVYRLVSQDTIEEYITAFAEKKLFLSAVVTEGGAVESSDMPAEGLIKKAIRFGASAVCKPPSSYDDFAAQDINEILAQSKQHGGVVENSQYSTSNFNEVLERKVAVDYKELEGVRHIGRSQGSIADEWHDLQKRERQERVVEIDGHMVLKETIPEPEVKAPKEKPIRKMVKASGHETTCLVCNKKAVDTNAKQTKVVKCQKCPRVYHTDCLSGPIELGIGGRWLCVQHRCTVCQRGLTQAGGLLYTCAHCPNAYCDECMPHDGIEEIGFEYPPMEKYDYADAKHVYFIKCDNCLLPRTPKKGKRVYVINNSHVMLTKHGVLINSFVAVRPDPKYGDKFWIGKVTDANKTTVSVQWLEYVGPTEHEEPIALPEEIIAGKSTQQETFFFKSESDSGNKGKAKKTEEERQEDEELPRRSAARKLFLAEQKRNDSEEDGGSEHGEDDGDEHSEDNEDQDSEAKEDKDDKKATNTQIIEVDSTSSSEEEKARPSSTREKAKETKEAQVATRRGTRERKPVSHIVLEEPKTTTSRRKKLTRGEKKAEEEKTPDEELRRGKRTRKQTHTYVISDDEEDERDHNFNVGDELYDDLDEDAEEQYNTRQGKRARRPPRSFSDEVEWQEQEEEKMRKKKRAEREQKALEKQLKLGKKKMTFPAMFVMTESTNIIQKKTVFKYEVAMQYVEESDAYFLNEDISCFDD